MISSCLVAMFAMGTYAFTDAEGEFHPSCSFVELKYAVSTGESVEYLAPGNCMRMRDTLDGHPRSRYFNCYAGCGGTKLQYKEYLSEDCTGTMMIDRMLHKGKMDPMTTDEGTVTAFDCSLAYCHVAETKLAETPEGDVQRMTRYKPVDRQQCLKDHSGYQWSECVDRRYLKVHHGPECHGTPSETKQLDYADEDSTDFHGVIREWDCNGFDNPPDDDTESEALMEHMMMLRNIQADRRKAQLALLEERNEAVKLKEWKDREVGKGTLPAVLFAGAILALGYYVYRKNCQVDGKATSKPIRGAGKYQPLNTEETTVTI